MIIQNLRPTDKFTKNYKKSLLRFLNHCGYGFDVSYIDFIDSGNGAILTNRNKIERVLNTEIILINSSENILNIVKNLFEGFYPSKSKLAKRKGHKKLSKIDKIIISVFKLDHFREENTNKSYELYKISEFTVGNSLSQCWKIYIKNKAPFTTCNFRYETKNVLLLKKDKWTGFGRIGTLIEKILCGPIYPNIYKYHQNASIKDLNP